MRGLLYIRKRKLVNRLIRKGEWTGKPCKPGLSAERTGCIPKKKPVPGQKRTGKLDTQQQVLSTLGKAGKGEGVSKEEAQHLSDNIDKLSKDQVKTALTAYQGKKGLWKLAKAALVSETLKQFKDKVGAGEEVPTIEGEYFKLPPLADSELDSMIANYDKVPEEVRDDVKTAVEDYALGDSYRIINPYLRGAGEELGGYEETVKNDIKNLETAIDGAGHVLDKDIVLYRGVGKVPFSTEIGSEYEDKGFTSGTASKDFAAQFVGGYGKKGGEEGFLIEMKIPSGNKVLVPIGSKNRKKEVILQHGTKFRVTGKKGNVIQVEAISGAEKLPEPETKPEPKKPKKPKPVKPPKKPPEPEKPEETKPEPSQIPKSETAQKFQGFEDGFSKGKPGEVLVPLAFPVYKILAEMTDIRDKIPAFLDSVKDIKSLEDVVGENRKIRLEREGKINDLMLQKEKTKWKSAAWKKLDNEISTIQNEMSNSCNANWARIQAAEKNKDIIRQKLIETFGTDNPANPEVDWANSGSPGQQKVFDAAFSFVSKMVPNQEFLKGKLSLMSAPGRAKFGMNILFAPFGNDSEQTVVHELGHWAEYNLPGAQDAAWEFVKYRCGGEDSKSMNEIAGVQVYGEDEKGRQNDFKTTFDSETRAGYAGKIYDDGATEIVSLGLEELYTNPVRFAKNDPEYFTFMMGVVQGKFKDLNLPKEEAVDAIPVEE